IAADAVLCALLGEYLGHADYCGLGHRVDALELARGDAVDRGNVDDAAATVGLHQLAAFDGHEVVAADVDVDGLLEGAQIGVQYIAELRVGGGVVDQDVEEAELLADEGKD